MEHDRQKMRQALVDTFSFIERPEPDETERLRQWSKVAHAVARFQYPSSDAEIALSLREIVSGCGELGEIETQVCAAHMACQMGVNLV